MLYLELRKKQKCAVRYFFSKYTTSMKINRHYIIYLLAINQTCISLTMIYQIFVRKVDLDSKISKHILM